MSASTGTITTTCYTPPSTSTGAPSRRTCTCSSGSRSCRSPPAGSESIPGPPYRRRFTGGVFLMAGVAWLLLQDALVKRNGPDSLLARAVGRDLKGKLSAVLYAPAVLLAFLKVGVADAPFLVGAPLLFGSARRHARGVQPA